MEQGRSHLRPPIAGSRRRPGRWSVRFRTALALVLLAALSGLEVEGQSGGLFVAVGSRGAALAEVRPGDDGSGGAITLRRRLVTIDMETLGRAAAGTTSQPALAALTLNLFDDMVLTGIVEQAEPTFSGGYALSGRIDGVAPGSMTLVVNGRVVAGSVRTAVGTYRIRPAGGAVHAISQIDPSKFPEGAEPLQSEPSDVVGRPPVGSEGAEDVDRSPLGPKRPEHLSRPPLSPGGGGFPRPR